MLPEAPIPSCQDVQSARAVKVLLSTGVEQLPPSTGQTSELVPLLFGLSLAVVLPPDALIAPAGPVEPGIWLDSLAEVRVAAVEAVLGRRTVAVGAGHVDLDEVDRRLAGLVVQLNAYRVLDAPVALVSTGLVTAGPPGVGFRATPRELWELAKEILIQRGQFCEPLPGLGDDAFLTLRGGCTAQVAWLTAGRLATVGVTSMQAEKGWAIASARALAERAGDQSRGLSVR